ncbi:MAG: hypothetical protein ACXWLH_00335 [Candidatus Saccharimonadales bacterium]
MSPDTKIDAEPKEKTTTTELESGHTLKVTDDGKRLNVGVFVDGNDNPAGTGNTLLYDGFAMVNSVYVGNSSSSEGIGTEVYRSTLEYLLRNYPSVHEVVGAAAHPHMASIFAKNIPEGWSASFDSSIGQTYTAEELLAEDWFSAAKETGEHVLINFSLVKQ